MAAAVAACAAGVRTVHKTDDATSAMQQIRHASLRRAKRAPVAGSEALSAVQTGLAGKAGALQLSNLAATRPAFCSLVRCRQGFGHGAADAGMEPAERGQTW